MMKIEKELTDLSGRALTKDELEAMRLTEARWAQEEQMAMDGAVRVQLDVGVQLEGGSVLVTVAGETQGVRLTTLVKELLESREVLDGQISPKDCSALDQVRHEMVLAANLIAQRVELERDRRRAREVI